ncbi:sigma-54-dependent Fis family transcriptional regulator [Nocardioides sp.]|uniref:sigma-54-dependent Fis family transcriptional regulator n=1 Tax=Nocardioides sp. TaxID=35761 RepID=UPI003D139517
MSVPVTDESSLPLRPAIAQSWRRADRVGLDPAATFDHLERVDVDAEGTLMIAAGPVLDELDGRLRDTKYSTILVDRDCRIVRRWSDDRRIDAGFEDLHLGIGTSLLEEDIGTNALGTVLETRESIFINGAEHYAEALRGFSCYGHPIRHPLTRRIEGVLDITAIAAEANPLLPALIDRAVLDIEQRLLDGSRASEKSLLDAFQAATSRHRRAMVAIGEDVVLSNQAALDLLGPGDVAMLRMLAIDAERRGARLDLSLESGRAVTVEVTPVTGARRGALLHVEPLDQDRARTVTRRSWTSREQYSSPLLVWGPPGSGRTTRARELAEHEPLTVLSPGAALLDGDTAWARDFEALMRRKTGSVCIDGIDLLSDRLLELVGLRVDTRDRPHLIFTSGPVGDLTGRAAALAGSATRREETLALSARRQDIPALAARMLEELEPGSPVHLTPSAITALSAQSWHGNLRELKAVMSHAVQRRWADAITVGDLPEGYRSGVPEKPIAPLEQAERDVIVATLQRCGGNKVRAAAELEVSRTTLYARMRSLRITTY